MKLASFLSQLLSTAIARSNLLIFIFCVAALVFLHVQHPVPNQCRSLAPRLAAMILTVAWAAATRALTQPIGPVLPRIALWVEFPSRKLL